MKNKLLFIPAAKKVVINPATGKPVPETGEKVFNDTYFRQRVRKGDGRFVESKPEKPEKKKKDEKKEVEA